MLDELVALFVGRKAKEGSFFFWRMMYQTSSLGQELKGSLSLWCSAFPSFLRS
jgi:hypothetical protein